MYDLLRSTLKQVKQNVPFAITELGQKCLEAAPTLKYGPLNSCITVLSV